MAALELAIAKDTIAAFEVLSPRERSVVALLADGFTAKEVAVQLGVSVKTVETHRSHAMEKVKVSGIADLTKYAIREGLTSLDASASHGGPDLPTLGPTSTLN